MPGKIKGKIGNAICHIYLIILSVVAAFPLIWVLLCSVKSAGDLTSNPTSILPKEFTLGHFKNVIDTLGFTRNIGNSLIIAFFTTVIAIAISSLAAYGIVRFFPKFGNIMSRALVTTYMFPPILLAIPYTLVMAKLGLTNTRVGLVIVYLSFSVPYAVWMLIGFFKTVPIGIEEAARVDGAHGFAVAHEVHSVRSVGCGAQCGACGNVHDYRFACLGFFEARRGHCEVARKDFDYGVGRIERGHRTLEHAESHALEGRVGSDGEALSV